MTKFDLVRDLIKDNKSEYQSLLDVGCRDCALKPYVTDLVKVYKGVDLYQNETNSVDLVCDFEKGLNLENESCDCVTALDLVEHLNDFEGGVDELIRIAKKDVMIMLPNISYLLFRLRFLFTGQLGNKYKLEIGMGQDRHRWVTILTQTDKFMRNYADKRKLKLKIVYFTDGKKKKALERFCKFLHLSPSLYVWSMLYVLSK